MNFAISIENLGKKYKLGQTHTNLLSEKIGNGFRRLHHAVMGRSQSLSAARHEEEAAEKEIWALKDVNLTIGEGEVIGFIGRNGAGKSTLLKILSRITDPTTGRIRIAGRVGSLLEVGTGFHPELTGRENILLNGAIIGMRKVEIKRKFDDIVGFADVGRFIDTPVKRYSSGMFVRLAFAVAAHLEPDILIVDEVLAVGDAAFQKKCLGKMQSVGESGRTVLFVSHNMTAIKDLCDRAVWLSSGEIIKNGKAKDIVSSYLHENSQTVLEQVWENPASAPGNEKVGLHLAKLSIKGESPFITVHTPIDLEFEYWNYVPGNKLNLSMHLYNLEGLCIFNSTSQAGVYPAGLIRSTCHIPKDILNDGTYRIMIMVVQDRSFGIYTHDEILVFDVQDVEREGKWHGKWPGVVRPALEWRSSYVGDVCNDPKLKKMV